MIVGNFKVNIMQQISVIQFVFGAESEVLQSKATWLKSSIAKTSQNF